MGPAHKVWLDCGHYFCEDCVGQYIATSIREGKTSEGTLLCPVENCSVPIEENMMKKLVSKNDWDKHLAFVKDRNVSKNPLLRWCPHSPRSSRNFW